MSAHFEFKSNAKNQNCGQSTSFGVPDDSSLSVIRQTLLLVTCFTFDFENIHRELNKAYLYN